eukprot:TRINITY_DN124494_c0_g1_i1.p4 TRINITY_DN124494_c0_g1~~TRINITY_DN124494_c0_g1_i1.p4  ORF type:complete len:58 (+),score=2.63 TRINITY_DN124494_c0_g1_i1:25-198(+)
MLSSITRFIRDEEGATAIEYGLIAGLISVVILVSLTDIGNNLKAIFNEIAGKLTVAS